jgi:iron complex transport system ATP-binding protein
MREGRLFLEGSAEEIITPDNLSSIYGTDFDVHLLNGKRIAVYF